MTTNTIRIHEFPGFEYYAEEPMFVKDFEFDQSYDEKEMAVYREFDAYQDFTDATAVYPTNKAMDYLMLGLVSEVGELASKMKKEIRDGTKFEDDDFIKELGDVLWYVARLAAEKDICLSDVAFENFTKLGSRLERGVIKGSGDNR